MIEFNIGQEVALREAIKWFKYKHTQVFEINGPAGTGKTTIIFRLIQELGLELHEVLFMAYVGKATLAMTRRGVNAKTIHSTTYEMTQVPKTDESGKIIYQHGRVVNKLEFKKKERLPGYIKLLVIDEGGMVPEYMAKDLLSFEIPIIVLGDLDQLPPVMGKSFFLKAPDVHLTEVVRQSADNPILKLATMARTGQEIKIGKYGDNCFVIPKSRLKDKLLTEMDAIICGTNRSRDEINNHYRRNILNILYDYPVVGDKVICRRNNWALEVDDISLINGLVGYVEDIYYEKTTANSMLIDFRPEFLRESFERIPIDMKFITTDCVSKAQDTSFKFSGFNLFEYGYAITCHLSQGSEYDKVLIIDDNRFKGGKYYRQWLYTAITRCKETLVLAI